MKVLSTGAEARRKRFAERTEVPVVDARTAVRKIQEAGETTQEALLWGGTYPKPPRDRIFTEALSPVVRAVLAERLAA